MYPSRKFAQEIIDGEAVVGIVKAYRHIIAMHDEIDALRLELARAKGEVFEPELEREHEQRSQEESVLLLLSGADAIRHSAITDYLRVPSYDVVQIADAILSLRVKAGE